MFAGHAAVALAAKPLVPRQSLGVLVAAAFWIDLVWPILLLAGVEGVAIHPGDTAFTPLDFYHYPWSHSLVMVLAWSVLFALVVSKGTLRPAKDAAVVVALVLSHWLLDFVTHRPDLPLLPGGSTKVGLGLWGSIPGTLLVEGTLFATGVFLYVRSTAARDRVGSIGLWSLLGLVFVIWVSSPFSPPPPSARAIAIVGLATWLIPLWAGWADAHRRAV